MRPRWLRTVALTGASCVLSAAPSTKVLAHQVEFEAVCPAPDPVTPVFLDYGGGSVGCTIQTNDDVDDFFFAVFAGMHVRVLLRGESLDPRLVVRDDGDLVVFDDSCEGSAGACTVSAELVAPSDGVYDIVVSEADGDETGDFRVQLEEIPGDVDEVTNQDEFTELEVLGVATDMDHFKVNAVVGQAIEIELESCDPHLDPRLEAWGPNGASLADVSCTTPEGPPPDLGSPAICSNTLPASPDLCTVVAEFDVEVTGIQNFSVSDAAASHAGRFRYTLRRMPEPAGATGVALWVLAALAQRRRRTVPSSSPAAIRAPVDGSGTI